ncbi:hypothetical protein ACFPN2_22350 [Steroidobacter flavus]|uniref:Lipoprotein n=1 Tax=Steroidobacter flavus TaxID=1842136 RepID=A0ABV8SYY8_9GAMM
MDRITELAHVSTPAYNRNEVNRVGIPPGWQIAQLAIGITMLMLAGCQKKHFEWTEEVRLADGSSVQVERSTRYGRVLTEMGGPTSRWVSEATVTIVEEGRKLPTWSHAMEPLVLDRDPATGRWRLLASAVDYCDYARRFGEPYVTYPTFELKGTEWAYVGMPESMLNRRANLLVGTPKAELGRDPHLSAEDVAISNAGLERAGLVRPAMADYCAEQNKLMKR